MAKPENTQHQYNNTLIMLDDNYVSIDGHEAIAINNNWAQFQ